MRLTFSLLLAGSLICLSSPVPAQEPDPDDRRLLDELLKTTLYDPPPAAERVVAKVTLRTCWGHTEEVTRDLWRLPGEGERPEQLIRADGLIETAVIAAVATRADLAAQARDRVKPRTSSEESDARFESMSRTSGRGPQTDHDLALAAWLQRRGEDTLAAQLLARLRKNRSAEEARGPTLVKELRADLAWQAFSDMVNAYIVCADEDALASGRHLFERYPEETKAYDQAKAVVAELERRKTDGTLGKKGAEKPPDGFEKKTPEEQIAWLVKALEDVDARQRGQPGGVGLTDDWRIEGLIDRGDAAVPALIDVLDKDERLMRSMHFWRDFSQNRTVLSVREGALVAVMSILRYSVFKPAATGSNFTGSGAERMQAVARELRAYWEANKGLKIEQRMLNVLTAAKSTEEQMREAAENLAELTHRRKIGTTVWSSSTGPGAPASTNPALALADPTAAEAILAAMDRDVARGDPRWKDDPRMWLFTLRKIESHYVECLIALDDKRICKELRRRCEKATEMRMRRQWALACHKLGDPEPMSSFLKDLAAAKLVLPPIGDPGERGHLNEEPGVVELSQCVNTIVRVDTRAADEAILAVTEAAHPWHDVLNRLLGHRATGGDTRGLFAHQYHLLLHAENLDKTSPTGSTYRLKGEDVWLDSDGHDGRISFDLESFKGVKLVPEARERRCDTAGERIAAQLLGVPRYHALVEDRDARREEIRATLKRFGRGVRRATDADYSVLGLEPTWQSPRFILGVQPLGHVATEKDVAEGKAIFHLGGDGKLADLRLPAKGRLKLDGGGDVRVLIVQAEQRASGEVRYGVIGADRILEVSAEKVEGVEPAPTLRTGVPR